MKKKVFWNPIVRYLAINALKLNISAILVFNAASKSIQDVVISACILAIFNGAPIVYYFALKKNKDTLSSKDTIKEIGAIYTGLNVTSTNQRAYIYPVAFFWRRCLFALITIYLFDYPHMQMIAHHVLTVVYISILVYNPYTFETAEQKVIEVGSEGLMHFTSIFLSLFNVASFDKYEQGMI